MVNELIKLVGETVVKGFIFIAGVTLFLLGVGEPSFGQQGMNDSYKLNVTPASPNAAGFSKYGDVPVGKYNGIPSIEIPLHTIKTTDLVLPITLSYHAGGIRLNEDAGWTGLGWTLNAGGVISRSIRDKDDLSFSNQNNLVPYMTERTTYSTNLFSSSSDTVEWLSRYYSVSGKTYYWANAAANLNSHDLQVDLFTYSFNGRSGKFAFTPSREVIEEKKSDLLIQYDGVGFIITDENGIKYFFAHPESTESGGMPAQVTSWYLSKIRSPRNDSIIFQYGTTPPIKFPDQYHETKRIGCDVSQFESTSSTVFHQIKHVTSVNFRGGELQFIYDNSREDYQFSAVGIRLREMHVRSNRELDPIKKFKFDYSYFNDGQTSYLLKRLRLDKLTEYGAGQSSLPPYQFHYHDVPVNQIDRTAKNSFSIDHWGFFNGAPNTGLIPPFNGSATWQSSGPGANTNSEYLSIPGANREVNPEFAKIFSLKEIKYPTGGSAHFDFDSNTFDFDNSQPPLSGSGFVQPRLVTKTKTFTIQSSGTSSGIIDFSKKVGKVNMTISFRCSSNDGCTSLKSVINFGDIYFESLGYRRDLKGTEVQCAPVGSVCTAVLNELTPTNGTHTWVAFIKSGIIGFQDINVTYSWFESELDQPEYQNGTHFLIGGGLRLRKLTLTDKSGKAALIRNFNYHYSEDRNNDGTQETYSFGKRMSAPHYFRNEIVPAPSSNRCATFVLYSSSIVALTASAQSSTIGYDQVEEFVTDEFGSSNGTTVYEFINEVDSIVSYPFPSTGIPLAFSGMQIRKPGLPNLSNPMNGTQKKVTLYAQVEGSIRKIREELNFYGKSKVQTIYDLAHEGFPSNDESLRLNYVFPAFRSQFIKLDSTVVRDFGSVDNVSSKKKSHFLYQGNNHFQVTEIRHSLSDGRTQIERRVFPLDNVYGLSATAFAARESLVAKHIISPTLLKETEIGPIKESVRTNYKIFDQNLTLPAEIEISTNTSSWDLRVEFKEYDQFGNIVSQAKKDDVLTTYCWGYNNSLVVAEVINATKDEVFYSSFEEVGGNSIRGDSYCGDFSSTVGLSRLAVGLTPGKLYRLTYWSKNGATWSFSSQDVIPTGTSYNITLTGQVDDVRFHPATSQMKTFTYKQNVGLSSILDVNNQAEFFEYDSFGRLVVIRDSKRAVRKKFDYNYAEE